ncbi:MAG: hypothetical protein LBD08_02115 [Treponema sp.]|nr:hypothetical protein [Treponema sp.]
MDRTGLIAKIHESVLRIDVGRKGQNTDGLERKGRINYEAGLSLAMEVFKAVQMIAPLDLELIMMAEYTFISQELQFCAAADTNTVSSLTNAIHDIDEAFSALKILENEPVYQFVEQSISHHLNFRYKGMVKDAFHAACLGHKARIRNILKSPGISLVEKELLQQRYSNMVTAQLVYLSKQKKALGIE